ncbi:intercellular adhesion molecule 1-like isoform X2 [Strix uralensis]|uniref:intercellular adhesion molecule 1-like isoform X2 n=1 Tax=Strix uralensis TaxID=36305 RepID=UPI003DA77D9A
MAPLQPLCSPPIFVTPAPPYLQYQGAAVWIRCLWVAGIFGATVAGGFVGCVSPPNHSTKPGPPPAPCKGRNCFPPPPPPNTWIQLPSPEPHRAPQRRTMDPCRSWGVVVVLFCFLLPRVHPGPCRVSISPEEPTVEFGTSILFNCTSSCRNYSRLDWEVSVTKMGVQGPGWVSLNIPNVTTWRLELRCFGNFGQQRNVTTTTLHAYRLGPPQIKLEGDAVAGKEAHVTCTADAQVAPPDPPNLLLTLRVGGLPPSTHPGPSAGLSFTAQPEQHGREVTCEAALRLRDRTVNASAAMSLWVWAAPHNIQVWAPRTVFAAGDNLTVMCRAEGNPPPRLRWELPTNASWELRDGGATVTIAAAFREHGGTYRCLAENPFGTGAASVNLLFQGSSRSPVIPVAVALAVVAVLAALAISWWFYRARGWNLMPAGSQPG